jgi:hypothetical protein
MGGKGFFCLFQGWELTLEMSAQVVFLPEKRRGG